MLNQLAVADEKGLITCDVCKEKDKPDTFAYVGPIDSSNKECNPFKGAEGNWEQICYKCETERCKRNKRKLHDLKQNGQHKEQHHGCSH